MGLYVLSYFIGKNVVAKREITQWYYEVWNEPDLADFWSGTPEQYFDLYRNMAKSIKWVCPTFRVGGPASAKPEMQALWQAFVAREHPLADFESLIHLP